MSEQAGRGGGLNSGVRVLSVHCRFLILKKCGPWRYKREVVAKLNVEWWYTSNTIP